MGNEILVGSSRLWKSLKDVALKQIGALAGLIGISVVLTILSPEFLTPGNLLNVARQISVIAIIAFGQTFVILTAGIDLFIAFHG